MKKHIILWMICLSVSMSAIAQPLSELLHLKENSGNEFFSNPGAAPLLPAFESEGYWV